MLTVTDRIERLSIPEPNSGCWIWMGAIDKATGYARMQMWKPKKLARASRISYQNYKGEIPEGMVIDHICRNTSCVNPDHLRAVTQGENIRSQFRCDSPVGACGHELVQKPWSKSRICMTCRAANVRRWRKRRKNNG
jgi:hypothetical protein